MTKNRSIVRVALVAAIVWLSASVGALAQSSTINPNIPGTQAPLSSATMRAQFAAAASDINRILNGNSASSLLSCTSTPVPFQDCLVTGGFGWSWYKWYPTAGWELVGIFNPSFTPASGGVASSIAVGTTNVTGGINGDILSISGGVLANLPVTGTPGSVMLSVSPTVTGNFTLPDGTIWSASGLSAAAINSGTLANNATALSVIATLPPSPSSAQNGVSVTITGNGSASQTARAANFQLSAGYTGASMNDGLLASNLSASSGNTLFPTPGSNAVIGSAGLHGASNGAGSGANIGVVGTASNSTGPNVGGLFVSQVGSGNSYGVIGIGTSNGGVFSIGPLSQPFINSAIYVDNASVGDPVAVFAVSGTAKVQINSSGSLTTNQNALFGTTANTPDAPVTITSQTGTLPSVQGGTLLNLVGPNGNFRMSAFGLAGHAPNFIYFVSNGNLGSESILTAGVQLGLIQFRGYNSTGYNTSSPASIAVAAVNNWSSSDTSTVLQFATTPSGSTSGGVAVSIYAGVVIGAATVDPGTGNLQAAGWLGTGSNTISGSGTVTGQSCGAPQAGARFAVTNGSSSPTPGAPVATGGSTYQSVVCNGTNWVYGLLELDPANDNDAVQVKAA